MEASDRHTRWSRPLGYLRSCRVAARCETLIFSWPGSDAVRHDVMPRLVCLSGEMVGELRSELSLTLRSVGVMNPKWESRWQ